MFLAAYMVTGFLLASVYAVGLLRGRTDRYVRLGFAIPFVVAAIAAPIQVMVGDVAARGVLEDQPAKFASMELIVTTGPPSTRDHRRRPRRRPGRRRPRHPVAGLAHRRLLA